MQLNMDKIGLIKIVNNKKKLIFIIVALSNLILHSQSIKSLEKEEVVFVYFEPNKNSNFYKEEIGSNNKMNTTNYHYVFKNLNKKSKCDKNNYHFWLRYSNYDDFDAMLAEKKTLSFKVHKSFLRKNKDNVITNRFIKNLGYKKISKLLRRKKIFLIDIADTEDNRYTIKEVKYSEPPEE